MAIENLEIDNLDYLPFEVKHLLLTRIYHLCQTDDQDFYYILKPTGQAIKINKRGNLLERVESSTLDDSKLTYYLVYSRYDLTKKDLY